MTRALLPLVVVLLLCPTALGQSRHDEYAASSSSSQAFRDAGEQYLELAARGANEAAAQQSAAVWQSRSGLLDVRDRLNASQDPSPGIDRPAGGALVTNLTVQLHPALDGVLRDAMVLFNESSPTRQRYLARQAVEDGVPQCLQQLDSWDAAGFVTQPTRDALLKLLEANRRFPLPALERADLGGSSDMVLRVEPDRAWYQQTVHVLVLGPAGTSVTLRMLGDNVPLVLDAQGLGEWTQRVPWSIDPGLRPITAQAGTLQAEADFTVLQVPTAFTQLRFDAPGANRSMQGRLLDADLRPMAGVRVDWQSQDDDRAGSTVTTSDGRFVIASPAWHGQLRYAGNRTHEPTQLAWTDPWQGTLLDEATLAELFARIGVGPANQPDEPRVPWLLIAALLVLLLLAYGLELHDVGTRLQVRRRLRVLARTTSRRPRKEHPLLAFVRGLGDDPDSMTLREAELVWSRHGAPDLHPWLEAHETRYYQTVQPVPAPARLLFWLRGRLR